MGELDGLGKIGKSIPVDQWLAMHKGGVAASPVDALARIGVTRTDGALHVSDDAIRAIREERAARMTVSRVPSMPRFLPREHAGLAVRKGAGRWGQMSMDGLRLIRERSPLIQSIHAARAGQIRRLSVRWSGRRGEVGWRVVHKDHFEHDARPPAGFERYIREFEKLFEKPAPTYNQPTTGALLNSLEDDLLTINRPVIEKLYSIVDRRRVVGFRAVDGSLIWPTDLWIQKWTKDNPGWLGSRSPDSLSPEDALDILSEAMRFDVAGAEFALVREGAIEATYRRGQLLVAPMVNRTDVQLAGYFPSNVEQALEVILTFINTWDYNASFFTRGMLAEFILGVSGSIHDDDLDAFADMLREATQGVARAWQPPIMPLPEGGKIERIDLKTPNREMMYDVFLSLQIALCTAVYGMDPSEINAKPWDGGAQPSLGAPNRALEISLAKERGLQGDAQHLKDSMLDELAMSCHPDLRVVFEFGDFDPQKEAGILELRTRTTLTRNEARLSEGLEPIGFWLPISELNKLEEDHPDRQRWYANFYNHTSDPSDWQAYQQAQQAAQAAMQPPPGEEPPPDDGFGETDDGTGGDGFGGPKEGAAPFGAPAGGGQAPPQAQGPGSPPLPSPATSPLQKAFRGRAVVRKRVTVYVEDGPARR